jgi:chromosome segregation ATPase
MDGEHVSISEQFFRSIADGQHFFVEREREFKAELSFLQSRLKEKEDENVELADEVNGKNCEIHELKKELEKWKDLAGKKCAEVEELRRTMDVGESNRRQPTTTEENTAVQFTGFPSDLSTVRFLTMFIFIHRAFQVVNMIDD